VRARQLLTSCFGPGVAVVLAGCLLSGPAGAQSDFQFAAPNDLAPLKKVSLWATQYYVSSANHSTLSQPQAYPLLGKRRVALGASLLPRPWCDAALEGTVAVHFQGQTDVYTYNYAGLDVPTFTQANCAQYFPNLGGASQMTRTLYKKVPKDAPFGFGDADYYRLVPFRSVAVDRARYPKGTSTVFFIPSLRGARIKSSSGPDQMHDGYFMAVDTGGAIKQNHIDVFTGLSSQPFATNVIKSRASGTFDAYVVTDTRPSCS
jgi:3D (Asp-Asp-Asp) domain-containing protein